MANLPILFNRWINAEWTTSHYLQDRPGTLTYFTCARGLWLLYGCYYDPTHNILPDNNSELWSYSEESKLVPTTETTYNLGLLYFKTSYILQENSVASRATRCLFNITTTNTNSPRSNYESNIISTILHEGRFGRTYFGEQGSVGDFFCG